MSSDNLHSEQELLTAVDEQSAFRILYDRYWQRLYEKALGRLGNDEDAQDVVQEIFISLWRNRQKVQVDGTLAPYLFTALKYSIIKRIHRKSQHAAPYPLTLDQLGSVELSPNEILQFKELQDIIEREVSELPERMQQIYRLSRTDYLTTLQIAETLGLSEQTVKNTLSTAVARLKDRLGRYNSYMLFLICHFYFRED